MCRRCLIPGYALPLSILGASNVEDMRAIKRDMIDPNPRASLQIGGVQPTMAAEALHTLRRMVELAGEMHVMLHVHLLEAEYNRQEEPLRALDLAGALGPMLLGAHAVHVTDDEIALLARRGVRLAHCPLSNMRLASGIMRLGAIHAQGLRVGLGLDGGTNDTSDMFNNMRAAVGLQRAVTRNPAVYPTVADALHLATLVAPRCSIWQTRSAHSRRASRPMSLCSIRRPSTLRHALTT